MACLPSRRLSCLVASAIFAEGAIAAFSWHNLGIGSTCQHSEDSNAVGDATQKHLVTSLSDCKLLCEQSGSCHGVSYSKGDGWCELLGQAVSRAGDAVSGAECLRLERLEERAVEVFVMMPLRGLVSNEGLLADQAYLDAIWNTLKTAGVDGFMVDVWWGITEPSPRSYDFSAYRELLNQAKLHGFKAQVVTSFHRCGGNVGDDCYIPLPAFVINATDVWYKDSQGRETQEYISLFADDVKIAGRTPLEMYSDWFVAFAAEFRAELGTTIVEVMVGLGPCGEMRYPSYPLSQWTFPGVGAFQCYDQHALASLKSAAAASDCQNCAEVPAASSLGSYSSYPQDTEFFTQGFTSVQGQFFLDWYSSALKAHAMAVLSSAKQVFGTKVRLAAKVAGLHWWYDSQNHGAELTAGYYNTNGRDAYSEIAQVLVAAGADVLDFTCLEMRDVEQPSHARSSPERLILQVRTAAEKAGIEFSGENALERYDQTAYDQMFSYKANVHSLTYLRMTETLVQPQVLDRFRMFVERMHAGTSGESSERPTVVPEIEPTVVPEIENVTSEHGSLANSSERVHLLLPTAPSTSGGRKEELLEDDQTDSSIGLSGSLNGALPWWTSLAYAMLVAHSQLL